MKKYEKFGSGETMLVDTAKVEVNTPCPTIRRALRGKEEEKIKRSDLNGEFPKFKRIRINA